MVSFPTHLTIFCMSGLCTRSLASGFWESSYLALNHSILYLPTLYLQEPHKTLPKGLSSSSPKAASQATFPHLGPKKGG